MVIGFMIQEPNLKLSYYLSVGLGIFTIINISFLFPNFNLSLIKISTKSKFKFSESNKFFFSVL